mgnify:CR=1 FL=1
MTTVSLTGYTHWDKEEPTQRPYRLWDANATKLRLRADVT